jgi:hypothetical protein
MPDECNIRRVAPAGVRFHFNVNCDTFKSGEERRLRDFSADPAAVPPGAPIEVTGIASLDGPADFNDALSCQRAEVVAGILREKHAVSLVRGTGGIGALHDADNRAVAVFVRVPAGPRPPIPTPVAPHGGGPLPVSPREQQCTVGPGIPNTSCGAYTAQDWWLPGAYVQNATCACLTTPNVPTANCVRLFLQNRLAATPSSVVRAAAAFKHLDPISVSGAARALVDPTGAEIYEAFVQSTLTPLIYKDHVDAYRSCCCPSGPAVYPSWIGVTTAPLPCSVTGAAIAYFGSCHGTPGTW